MGANADNHSFGPDKVINASVVWRFSISKSSPASHVFSPPMTRSAAKTGAAYMRDGDAASARSSWGSSVCDWLDALTEGQRAELYEAAAESVR